MGRREEDIRPGVGVTGAFDETTKTRHPFGMAIVGVDDDRVPFIELLKDLFLVDVAFVRGERLRVQLVPGTNETNVAGWNLGNGEIAIDLFDGYEVVVVVRQVA